MLPPIKEPDSQKAMSLATESGGSLDSPIPRGDTSTFHPSLMGGAFNNLSGVSSTDEAQVIEVPSGSPGGHESPFICASGASVNMNEAEREGRHEAELQEGKNEEDDNDDCGNESTMEEFGLKYDEDSDTAHQSGDESDGVSEYASPRGEQSEPLRARNRSGPPIPPPVPVRPGQLYFSNQIWTRLNVEQQLKLGALKVGSKNKSFKTRPWLVVEKSDRVDADGQQMLWVMCCTTRNRHGWDGVSHRDSKSFIPMAPTPSRFGRPVLPLVADDREVFLGGSLLFLEVFKEIKPTLLGDYIGHISDESVRIVNKEQARIAEERRKKEELRVAHAAASKAKAGGGRRKSDDRSKHKAEKGLDYSDRRGSFYSGNQGCDDERVTSGTIQPFQLPPCTNVTQVSPPLDPTAPSFCDPASQGQRGNRKKSLSSRGIQNRQQYSNRRQNYPNLNQTPGGEIHSPQTYGGHGGYGNYGGYGSPGSYGGHENHGNHGRRRSSTGGLSGYPSPQRDYRGRNSSGYFPDNARDSGSAGSPARDASQQVSHVSGFTGYPGDSAGNSGWVSGAFGNGGPGWQTARQYQRR